MTGIRLHDPCEWLSALHEDAPHGARPSSCHPPIISPPQLFFAVSWGIRLHVAWGASLRTAVLAAAFSFPLGMAYELGWDVVTAVFGFFLGSTESLNAAIRSVAYFCCNGRPGCFSLAANLRVFRIKLLLEPWLNALPQAVVQVRGRASYRTVPLQLALPHCISLGKPLTCLYR